MDLKHFEYIYTFDEKHKSNVIENLEILKISINQNLF